MEFVYILFLLPVVGGGGTDLGIFFRVVRAQVDQVHTHMPNTQQGPAITATAGHHALRPIQDEVKWDFIDSCSFLHVFQSGSQAQ